MGTKGYLAPEGPGKPSADIYSLGRVLHQAWTGLACERYPELPAEVMKWPDRERLLELNELIIQACDADPAGRAPPPRR